MSFLPSELWRHILQLQSDLCYQISRDSWKNEWLKNISVVNEEYSCNWAWSGYSLRSIQQPGNIWKMYMSASDSGTLTTDD